MLQRRTCPHGHQWESANPDDLCPVCSSADHSWDRSQSSTFPSRVQDELPPPPDRVVRTVQQDMGAGVESAPARRLPILPGYEILGELGRGGMGVVYRALHLGLNRLVALKVVRTGEHADPQELARFQAEAEAVARLQHPNIVQIFEVGETNGLPYFALELVDGGSLAERLVDGPLPARAAAELTQTLARAIHYAHERGVVHRDLKPANILLAKSQTPSPDSQTDQPSNWCLGVGTGELSPKVTDFGLAKRLDVSAWPTVTGQVMGTPSYMAPEQAAGAAKAVGPAADVYALGAILYELLTGRSPFRAATPVETLYQVLHEEPIAPTQLQPGVPRDLETICRKCLLKEPHRRYATAGALADDLRRFLDGEPVQARPTGSWERGLKWVKRRPAVAALIAVIAAAAVSLFGLGLASYLRIAAQQVVIEQRGRSARANYERALLAVKQIIDVTQDRLAHVPRMEQHRRAMLEEALKLYEDLLPEGGSDADVRRDAGHAFAMTGKVYEDLDEPEKAEGYYRRSLELRAGLVRDFPERRDCQLDLARSHLDFGWLFKELHRPSEAESFLRDGVAILERLNVGGDGSVAERKSLASAHYLFGHLFWTLGRSDDAQSHYREAVRIWGRLAAESPTDPEHWYDLGGAYLSLGAALRDAGRLADAEREYLEALRCKRQIADPDFVARPFNQGELARIHVHLGGVYQQTGRSNEAESQYGEALRIQNKLAEFYPAVPMFRLDLGRTHLLLAGLLHETNRPEPAVKSYRRAHETWQKLARDLGNRAEYQKDLAESHDSLGDLLAQTGKLDEAENAYREGLTLWQKLASQSPARPDYRLKVAAGQVRLGAVFQALGRSDAADKAYRVAIDLRRQLVSDFPQEPGYRGELADGYDALGNWLRAGNRFQEAETAHRQSRVLREKLAEEFPDAPAHRANLAHNTHSLGLLLADQGRYSDAGEWYRKALAAYEALVAERPTDPGHRRNLAVVANNLANLRQHMGRTVEAEQAHRRSLENRRKLADEFPHVPEYRQHFAHSLFNLGVLLLEAKRYTDAEPLLRKAVEVMDRLRKDCPTRPDYGDDLNVFSNSLGNLLRQTRRYREAETIWRTANDLQAQLVRDHPNNLGYRYDLAISRSNFGLLLLNNLHKTADAETSFEDARVLLQKLTSDFPSVPDYRALLGDVHHCLGMIRLQESKLDDVRRHIDAAIEQVREALKPFPGHTQFLQKLRSHYQFRADVLVRQADHVKAAKAVAELVPLGPERWGECFAAAGILARCSDLAAKDGKLTNEDRVRVARDYADRAVQLLKQARDKGWKGFADAWKSPDFKSLKDRDDFKKIVGRQ